ncbi:MAG: hypothetical protein J7L31_00890 [Thermoplasmata archaeon]|nr:hypothetical protein [Thermoplasmata archaeon]
MVTNDVDKSSFESVAEEIDQLCLEGLFGDKAKKYVSKREQLSESEYFYNILNDWINYKEQVGKMHVYKLLFLLLRLYVDAISIGQQKAIDTIAAFFYGFPEIPDSECFTSYNEYAVANANNKRLLRETTSKRNIGLKEQKILAQSYIGVYQKGVELVNKILTILIPLLQISNRDSVDPMKIYKLSLYEKIIEFEKLSNGIYDDITNSIDRIIRNASSHLDARFDASKSVFKFRVIEKGKIKIIEKTVEEFMAIFIKMNGVIQAFIFSGCLLALASLDKEKYIELIKKIVDDLS